MAVLIPLPVKPNRTLCIFFNIPFSFLQCNSVILFYFIFCISIHICTKIGLTHHFLSQVFLWKPSIILLQDGLVIPILHGSCPGIQFTILRFSLTLSFGFLSYEFHFFSYPLVPYLILLNFLIKAKLACSCHSSTFRVNLMFSQMQNPKLKITNTNTQLSEHYFSVALKSEAILNLNPFYVTHFFALKTYGTFSLCLLL